MRAGGDVDCLSAIARATLRRGARRSMRRAAPPELPRRRRQPSSRRRRRRTSRPARAWDVEAPVAARAPAACRLRRAVQPLRPEPRHPRRSGRRRRTRTAASLRARGASASRVPARRWMSAGEVQALRAFRLPEGGERPTAGRDAPSAEIGGTGGTVKAVRTGGGATTAGSTAATAADTAVTTSWTMVAAVSVTIEPVAGGVPTDSVICEVVCAIAFTVAVVACATAAIVCVTGPSSPGLPMRMEMFEFCG